MADLSDVEQAVADTVALTLYPAGPSKSSIIGTLCRVYRGWPNSATLNTDLSAGTVNVTVVSDNSSGRTTTRFLPEWKTRPSRPGVMASAEGQVITISGTPVVGDVVGVLINGSTYAYRIQEGDSPNLVASNLNQVIQADLPATAQMSNITVAGAHSILVRVVCDNSTSFESRRQEKDIRIICWCPSPQARDSVVAAIDAAIDLVNFLVLSDDSSARIIYRNTASYDQAQNALLYRRDLVYTVEYPTVTVFEQPSMLFGASDLNSNITYG
jgi:hypothetical protein